MYFDFTNSLIFGCRCMTAAYFSYLLIDNPPSPKPKNHFEPIHTYKT